MTSLFRRSSNGGSRGGEGGGEGGGGGTGGGGTGGGGGGSSTGELNNSRPNRQVRRLEFNQAMKDFKTMFPSMDYEVIECVLRSNNGAVDATIDQLLQMSIDDNESDDSSDSDESIPSEILERTLEPDSSDEEPPPVYSPPTYDMHMYDRKYPNAPPTPPPRFEVQSTVVQQPTRSYRNWNPPLLGNLPDDFLRILPQQSDSIQSCQSSMVEPSTSQASQPQHAAAVAGASGVSEQERKLKQYLEDERIALFLQNEEFMKELQRNREFLDALERDRLKYESKKSRSAGNSSGDHYTPGSFEACMVVSDDALFRDKLKHMGKSTRKKLFEIAKGFSEKTKRRKAKRRTLLRHHYWALPTPLPIYWMTWKETPVRRRVSSEDQPCRKRSGPTGKRFHDPSCHLVIFKVSVVKSEYSQADCLVALCSHNDGASQSSPSPPTQQDSLVTGKDYKSKTAL